MFATLKKFPAAFYIANFMEIFERMAWYGFYAVASLYITGSVASGGLGLTDQERGVITGVVPFLLYLFPVVTGALADKFGFKKTFFVAFAIMAPGYLIMGIATGFWTFFMAFLAVAVGAALFKPVVTGTVARVTSGDTKALGFGIFYMIVNVGGFVGPLVATVVRGWGWEWVFRMSAFWISFNFVWLFLFYKEPPSGESEEDKAASAGDNFSQRMHKVWRDMTQVLGNTRLFLFVAVLLLALMLAGGETINWGTFGLAVLLWTLINVGVDFAVKDKKGQEQGFWVPMRLGDWRFALYLLLLAGFWTEFNQIFLTMPLYIRDYVDTTGIQDGVRGFFAAIPAIGDSLVQFWNWALTFLTKDGQIKPENLVNIDALAIIFGQVAITALIMKWKPFTTMVIGTLITGVSMLLGIGASVGSIAVLAIVVFAIGEMMASPKSQEYVARIAPPGKEAMYMGYYFVSIALGNLFGGLLSGQAYGSFANKQTGNGHPEIMWMLFAAISVLTALALVAYNRYVAPRENPEEAAH